MTSKTEQDLIARARAGDGEAISTLYSSCKESVYRFIFYRIGSQGDSEDLFQEVMLAAFDSLPRFRGEVSFRNWCYQIARNKIAYFWRNQSQQETLSLEEDHYEVEVPEEEPEESFQKEALLMQQKDQLTSLLQALPERYREVLELRFFQEKTLSQAAEVLQVSVANIKVLQHRALKKAVEIFNSRSL